MSDEYLTFGHRLEQFIADTATLAHRALDDHRVVLFEGAQGALLDIDHGTYPFVTSSNPVAGRGVRRAPASGRGTSTRSGASRRRTRRASARGRSRPSSHDETGVEIRERGGEFGTTTGRPRRTGWLDLVALKYAARLNSMTSLVITKLDVLGGFDRIKVCTRYRGEEEATFDAFPYHQSVLHHAVGEYTELPGWSEDISGVRSEHDLPAAARDYLRFVADYIGVPVVARRASGRGGSRSSGPASSPRRSPRSHRRNSGRRSCTGMSSSGMNPCVNGRQTAVHRPYRSTHPQFCAYFPTNGRLPGRLPAAILCRACPPVSSSGGR